MCDIYFIDNLWVLKYLVNDFGVDEEVKMIWYKYWVEVGFESIEKLFDEVNIFCVGDKLIFVDVCLVL